MLLVSLRPNILITKKIDDLGEECIFFVVVMGLDKLEPSQRVCDEISLVCVGDVRRLEPDGIESTNDAVVQHRHVACAGGEDVILETGKKKRK